MTTWTFNVARELVGAASQVFWIRPDSGEETLFCSADAIALGKCHHFSRRLAECADIVVYSYRDVRTAAVSSYRKFGTQCPREEIEGWLDAERMWLPHASLVLRYEEVERAPLATIGRLRDLISRRAASATLSNLSDERILERVEKTFDAPPRSESATYDPATLVFPGHRTYQPSPERLLAAEREIYERVGHEFRNWLASRGYLEDRDYGQSVEYAIAAAALRCLQSPTVVDVGVERGTFTELALRSGGARVIGFEPLPRHVEHLRRRFAGAPKVEIHALAVSNHSGSAQFHIATDRDGNELDFHHTLSDIADSSAVIRSKRTLEVPIATLADLARDSLIPSEIDLLKVDTDGHDLAVLQGWGHLRPRIVMAEYWDTLPETSGTNPYRLSDLAEWVNARDYPKAVVVRRNGRLQLIGHDEFWTVPGDWGNVFFFRRDFDYSMIRAEVERFSRECYASLGSHVSELTGESDAKETEIRRLHSDTREKDAEIGRLSADLAERQTLIERLSADLAERQTLIERLTAEHEWKSTKISGLEETCRALSAAMRSGHPLETDGARSPEFHALTQELIQKETVIRELRTAVDAYRATFAVLGIFIVPFNHLVLAVRSVIRRSTKALRPRLGVLNQHEPRELRLPAHYSSQLRVISAAPKISIVTPSFGQAEFIERTIVSVLDQRYPNLEYYVQDGGSQDGTREVLQRYADRLSGWDSRLDSGQTQAINRGFARTTGDIMAWLNSDDILLPGALAYVADYFNRHPEVDVIYGDRILIDESDRQIGRWVLPSHDGEVLSWADYVPQETLFWRRRIWERVGGQVDESFRFALDWDLLVRFRDAGARFARLPRFLGGFRIHPHQKTSASISDIGFQEMDRIRQRTLGRVPSRMEVSKALLPYLVKHVAADLTWRIRGSLGARP